jgi:tetratricopeptide (TPR) repeat protein
MKRTIIIFLFSLLSFLPSIAFAAIKTFEKEYIYQASEADSKQTCRTLALEQVKRLLLEEIGTYLESQTVVKNFQLTHDQIITLTAGVVKTEIVTERWDGKEYQLMAKISADPDGVALAIDNLRGDQQKVKELEEAKKKTDEKVKEVDQLRKELTVLKSAAKRKNKINQYSTAVKNINLIDLYSKAMSSSFDCVMSSDRCQNSIDAFQKIIELDPGNADAYFESGWSYRCWEKYKEAIDMNTKALTKGTKKRDYVGFSNRGDKNENVYERRGDAYFYSGNYKAAINDYSIAIKLRTTFSKYSVSTYIQRGEAYLQLSDYQKAISNFDEAVMIAANDDNYRTEQQSWWSEEQKKYFKYNDKEWQYRDINSSYSTRGRVYFVIGNFNQAIIDFTKAIETFPYGGVRARTYYFRAISYIQLGNVGNFIGNAEKAIRDMDKAVELDPKESSYYNYRATVKTLYMHSIIGNLTKKETGSFAANNAYEILKKRADHDANIANIVNYCSELEEQTIYDHKIAAKLGYKLSQEYLSSQGITW